MGAIRFSWSVIPSLLAWPATCLPPTMCFSTLAASFGAVYFIDASFAARGLLGVPWFITLRKPLTAFAAGTLGMSAVNALGHEQLATLAGRGEEPAPRE